MKILYESNHDPYTRERVGCFHCRENNYATLAVLQSRTSVWRKIKRVRTEHVAAAQRVKRRPIPTIFRDGEGRGAAGEGHVKHEGVAGWKTV